MFSCRCFVKNLVGYAACVMPAGVFRVSAFLAPEQIMVKQVAVAAAVITRPDGTFLLGQRAEDTVYSGYWEFPGGKVEAGETPRDALVRELSEELGIVVDVACPWLMREHVYDNRPTGSKSARCCPPTDLFSRRCACHVSWRSLMRSRSVSKHSWPRSTVR
jgi:hypothetical protein